MGMHTKANISLNAIGWELVPDDLCNKINKLLTFK